MEYTLEKLFEIKGAKSITRQQADAFNVKDYNRGWTKRYAKNTVSCEVWETLVKNLSHHPATRRAQRSSSKDNQYLYLFKSNNGLCKIGVSADFRQRAKSLMTATGFGIKVLGVWNPGIIKAVTLEALLFKHFGKYRKLGEWFEFPEDFDALQSVVVFLNDYNNKFLVRIARVK